MQYDDKKTAGADERKAGAGSCRRAQPNKKGSRGLDRTAWSALMSYTTRDVNCFVIHKGNKNESWKTNIRPKAKPDYNQTK